MAGEVLRLALGRLDELSKRGGGALAVIPQSTAQIAATAYSAGGQDFIYIAWPQGDYDAINMAWAQIAPLTGARSPFGSNQEIAKAIAANNWVAVPGLFKFAQTVDQARASIRALLTSLGIATTAIHPRKATKKFPWGWVAGTLALGVGIMLSLNFTRTHGEAP